MEKKTYTMEQLLQDYQAGRIRTFEELERAVLQLKGGGEPERPGGGHPRQRGGTWMVG